MSGRARRILLRSLAAGTALPLVPAPAAPAEGGDGGENGFSFFATADARFIAAAADCIIPQDGFPSASQAGVVDYIDRQLAGDYGRGRRMYLAGPYHSGSPEQGYQLGLPPAVLYRESLDALLSDAVGRQFAHASSAEQDRFLRELEAGAWLLGRVPSSVFFETLLANVIEGYFADPMYGGNRNMAGWRMIGFPGAYANYAQWVGRHNVRFNRPPVAIASHHGTQTHGHGSDHTSGHADGNDARLPASIRPASREGS